VDVVNLMLDDIERLMHEVKGVSDGIAHDLRTPLTRLSADKKTELLRYWVSRCSGSAVYARSMYAQKPPLGRPRTAFSAARRLPSENGTKRKVMWCVPAGTSRARNSMSARRIGVALPSISAIQPG